MTNVIYIHTHDSGDVFSPYHYDVPTPTLQKFSEDSCLFTNAFCASPTCSPSRSALLTGKYPHSNGMMGLANRGFEITNYEDHLVHVLNENKFQTVLCGIQHEYGRYTEHDKGAKKIGYQVDITTDPSAYSEKEMVEWDRNNVQSLKKWLASDSSKQPFFLSFGFFSTHREYPDVIKPLGTLPAFLDKSETIDKDFQGHCQSLQLFDDRFNEIMEALKENKLYDNTIILFTSDHGIPYPKAKCTLFDAGIKIALMMKVPGAEASVIDGLVSHVDIAPTLCSLLNIESKVRYEGVDLTPLIRKEKQSVREYIYSEVNFHTSYEPIRCVRSERYKYIRYYDEDYQKINASNIDNSISKEEYLKTAPSSKTMEYFFDLKNDPFERNNLINHQDYQDEMNKAKRDLLAWQKDTHDYLLDPSFTLKSEWIVNTKECLNPKSKNKDDFIVI